MRARKGLFAWVGLSLCAGAFGAVPISNFRGPDGFPVLVPEVRERSARDSVFVLPERFTVSAPPTAQIELEQLAGDLARWGTIRLERTSARRAVFRLELTEKGVPDHDQGYALEITEKGIRIAARTERGLFYGVQTLRNLLRKVERPELPGCSIWDYPDLERRGFTFNMRFTRSEQLPQFFRIVDAMASLKLNFLMLEFGDNFPLEGNPFSLRDYTFSPADIKAIRDFCRERHIEIGIRLQVLSHVRWMETHPEYESMLEGPSPASFNPAWNMAYCPQNELAQALVEQTLREQLSFFRPRLGYIVYDEITNLCPFQVCEKCKARDPVELLAEHLEFATRIVEEEGALTVVAQDSFLPDRLHGAELAEHLDPERHAVLYWRYEPDVVEEELTRFSDRGHPAIGLAIAGNPYNLLSMARLNHAHNTLGTYMAYWYYSHGNFNRPEHNTAEIFGGITLGANYLWNLDGIPPESTLFDPTFEMRRRFDPPRNLPPAGAEAVPVPIGPALNTELNADGAFPQLGSDEALSALQAALTSLPERFDLLTAENGAYFGIVLSGGEGDGRPRAPVTLPYGQKAQILSFLVTTSRPDHQGHFRAFRHYGKYVYRFDPVADVSLVFADGTEVRHPLRYRFSVTDWNRLFGGYDMRFAVSGTDDEGAFYSLGIYDFANPYPEKTIESITFSTRQWNGIAPAVLAVSAFGPDKGALPQRPVPDFNRIRQETAARVPAESVERVVMDFEDGPGTVQVVTWGVFDGTVESEIVSDPTCPEGEGRVFKITVPPAELAPEHPYIRISVDLPYQPQEGIRSLRVDHRISHPQHLHHANDYLVNTQGPQRTYFVGRFEPTEKWERTYLALSGSGVRGRIAGLSTAPLTNPMEGDLRRVSFFFERIPEPITLYVDNIGDSTAERHVLPLRTTDHYRFPY